MPPKSKVTKADPVPRLVAAMSTVVSRGLRETPDRWVRVDVPFDWPAAQCMLRVNAYFDDNLRVAVLRPFDKEDFDHKALKVEARPWVVTNDWRNDSGQDGATVVLGPADGPEEDGLRHVRTLITEEQIFDEWLSMLADWTPKNVDNLTVPPVLRALVDIARRNDIDSNRLDEYIAKSLSARKPLDDLRRNLWMLSLIPDDRLLDVGGARGRLEANLDVQRLLLSSADSLADQRKLERLLASADPKNSVVKGALEFMDTQDPEALIGCQLDALLKILNPKRKKRDKKAATVDLFEMLDFFEACESSTRLQALDDLNLGWELDADEVDLTTTFTDGEGTDYKVQITCKPEDSFWAGTETDLEQVLAWKCLPEARRDWITWPPEGEPVSTDEDLERLARGQDALLGGDQFASLAAEYLKARSALQPYERWLRNSALPLLILDENARISVREFLACWLNLVDAALAVSADASDVIRDALLYLEGMWSVSEDATEHWCVLGPFHPYTLEPLLQVAELVNERLGDPHLGSEVAWILDRSLPAYRAIWSRSEPLMLARSDGALMYSQIRTAQQPTARSGNGVSDVARAYLDYHPFAKRSLTITLIDPPKGGAVGRCLRRVEQLVDDLRVNVVVTRGQAAQPEDLSVPTSFLGRYRSVGKWLASQPVRTHLTFLFSPQEPGSASPLAETAWAPTPGAHVALQVGVRSGGVMSQGGMTPYVTFEPREKNRVVLGLKELSPANQGAPKLFEVQPMLGSEETSQVAQLFDYTDWLILGAPAPLGLVPAKDLGEDFAFIGRCSLGPYGLFVYCTSLFSIRRNINSRLKAVPAGTADTESLERKIVELAEESGNGVLRMGRGGTGIWEQIGILVASDVSKGLTPE